MLLGNQLELEEKIENVCTVLYCTVLYCTVLYCTVLYCTVLYCTVLYCTYTTALFYTVLYCTVHIYYVKMPLRDQLELEEKIENVCWLICKQPYIGKGRHTKGMTLLMKYLITLVV